MLEKYKDSQQLVTDVLQKSLNSNKLVQAYLFSCDDINFIYEYAKDFAKDIISLSNLDEKTLNNIYKRIDKEEYTELKIIKPDGNIIKKGQLLELQNSVVNKPVEANKIIYIIKNCEKLNSSSANSILKFLEEPEEDIIAILLTDNINMVLPTIKSRCQVLNFENQNANKMNNILFFDNYEITEEEQKKYIDNVIEFIKTLEKYKINTFIKIKKLVYDIFKSPEDIRIMCNIILYFYDDCINYKLFNKVNYLSNYIDLIEEICKNNETTDLGKKIQIIKEAKEQLDYNANTKLLIDKIILEISEV